MSSTDSMPVRALGQSELRLSAIGLGTWAIGGGGWAYGWGPQDDAESIAAIRRGIALGINWIDTAAVYGLGHGEEVVARALDGVREEVVVATKGGLRWRDSGAVYSSLSRASIREEVDASLRRLRCPAIDLYQIHWPRPKGQLEEAWSTLADLVRDGKLRYLGVSNFTVEQMRRLQPIHPITSLQPPYSMINRAIEAEILPFCAEQQIGVIAYSPLQCGLLSGHFSTERLAALDAADFRRSDRFFREPVFSEALAFVARLTPIAHAAGLTLAQLAIAWVLRRAEVTAAIVGARRPSQIEETITAACTALADTDQQALAQVIASLPRSLN